MFKIHDELAAAYARAGYVIVSKADLAYYLDRADPMPGVDFGAYDRLRDAVEAAS
ncbi:MULTISPECIES: hypothetical protein [Streptosporangium]|uniref:Uncharacterized protein n=1 Tax=Streptosporangium brasiliense TaxID=47480 RepID=A0ABT9RM20_9ACTN|nr:hypothetical protein [Streptosporangium brasiliense]MDP9870343.1 hypothetical protein [Streptosporangium brasiliense]